MANIALKTIKFPGIDNTYTLPVSDYKIYRSLSELGLSGSVTTQQIFEAMPYQTMFIYTNSSASTTEKVSDAPTSYCLIELIRDVSYGSAKATKINSDAQEFYEGSYYSTSGFKGWVSKLTRVLTTNDYGTTLPATNLTEGRVFFLIP